MALPARARILKSVFPSAPLTTSAPTPQATPLLGQNSFNDHSPTSQGLDLHVSTGAPETVKWERAWHVATSFIIEQLKPNPQVRNVKDCPQDVQIAIRYVRSPESVGYRLRKKSQADDLIWWYSQVIQLLFLKQRRSTLVQLCDDIDDSEQRWNAFQSVLLECRNSLLKPYRDILAPLVGHTPAEMSTVEDAYKALVLESLSTQLEPKLLERITSAAAAALGPYQDPSTGLEGSTAGVEGSMEGVESSYTQIATDSLLGTLTHLVQGGFASTWLERLLAKALNGYIHTYVVQTCAREWYEPEGCVGKLKAWIFGPFRHFAQENLLAVAIDPFDEEQAAYKIEANHIADWQQHAIDELGLLRLRELFDIVVAWDDNSKAGIDDLKHYVTTPARRMYVVNTFVGVLSYRLLIPGASTTEILQMYSRIIRAFGVLDLRYVILDRVARPIRRYLRDRDDTVKIIVSGLLADPDETDHSADVLSELATEMQQMYDIAANSEELDFDWDDLNWMPNPADAEQDFKKSKHMDVIGNLMTLFETKEVFVHEFQNILGERLLGADVEFNREIRVLELLKSRFGDAALQGCEVMLKDIFDSRRTDLLIKKEQEIQAATDSQPEIYAKIVSRFFWPSLRDEEFRVPAPVRALQERYAHGFEEHKMQRKLAWLPALGQVTVELHLKHRTVKELVTTWQASVIYAFSSDDDSPEPVRKTAEELTEELEMDEDLLANALTFWVSKLVLYEPQPGTYEVLETLPSEEEAGSAAGEQKASADIVAAAQSASAAAAASAASAVRSEEELAEEKMEVVWQYVVGMLTNQGSMPLQQMVMMLNFVVPGGFTHSNEEFRSFLQRRVDDGRLEMTGANYKIPKK